jgi:NitT/TauT family transport system substrate-binding protein
MNNPRQRHAGRVLLIVILLLFAAAGGVGYWYWVHTQTPVERPFVVAIPTYPGFGLPYLAQEKGLFQGTRVELKRIDDAAATNAGLIRGDIDACFTSVDAFVLAASQGVTAKAALMADESRGADGIVAKPAIRTVADLKGKRVAANLGWPGHFFLLYNLRENKIPFADVKITDMEADKAASAFSSGELDAAVTWEPHLSAAVAGGKGHILVSTRTLPGVIVDTVLVREDVIRDRPAAVQAFVDGYYRALRQYTEDPAGSGAIMAKALDLKPEEFKDMTGNFRFIPADEAAKMLQPGDAVTKLFHTAADIWLEAKVIDRPVSDQGRTTEQFVRGYLEKK